MSSPESLRPLQAQRATVYSTSASPVIGKQRGATGLARPCTNMMSLACHCFVPFVIPLPPEMLEDHLKPTAGVFRGYAEIFHCQKGF